MPGEEEPLLKLLWVGRVGGVGLAAVQIIDALSDASGRIAGKGGAAERLGLKRTTLQNKMRRLSIGRSDYSADQYTNRIAGSQATS